MLSIFIMISVCQIHSTFSHLHLTQLLNSIGINDSSSFTGSKPSILSWNVWDLQRFPLGLLLFSTYTLSLGSLLHTNASCRQINISNPKISLWTFRPINWNAYLVWLWRSPKYLRFKPQNQPWWPKLQELVSSFCCYNILLQLYIYLWSLLSAW